MENSSELDDFIKKRFGSRIDINAGLGFLVNMKSFPSVSSAETIRFANILEENKVFWGSEAQLLHRLIWEEIDRVIFVDNLLANIYSNT